MACFATQVKQKKKEKKMFFLGVVFVRDASFMDGFPLLVESILLPFGNSIATGAVFLSA